MHRTQVGAGHGTRIVLWSAVLAALYGCAAARVCKIEDVRKVKTHTWNFKGCTKIDAKSAELRDADVVELARHLEGDKNVVFLDLAHNHFGDEGAAAVATLLEHRHTAVSHVWLTRNKIGCGGIKAVAHAIKENVILKELHLAYNHIHADGAEAIAEALTHNSNLEFLDIEHNAFHYRGTKALGRALEENTGLKRLNIGHNRISDVGARDLVHSLRANKHLEHINLRGNGIGDSGMHEIARVMKRNRHIVSINLGHNNASPESMKEVIKRVRYNVRRFQRIAEKDKKKSEKLAVDEAAAASHGATSSEL